MRRDALLNITIKSKHREHYLVANEVKLGKILFVEELSKCPDHLEESLIKAFLLGKTFVRGKSRFLGEFSQLNIGTRLLFVWRREIGFARRSCPWACLVEAAFWFGATRYTGSSWTSAYFGATYQANLCRALSCLTVDDREMVYHLFESRDSGTQHEWRMGFTGAMAVASVIRTARQLSLYPVLPLVELDVVYGIDLFIFTDDLNHQPYALQIKGNGQEMSSLVRQSDALYNGFASVTMSKTIQKVKFFSYEKRVPCEPVNIFVGRRLCCPPWEFDEENSKLLPLMATLV